MEKGSSSPGGALSSAAHDFLPWLLLGNLGLQNSLWLLSIVINLKNVINRVKIINLNTVINLNIYLISVHSRAGMLLVVGSNLLSDSPKCLRLDMCQVGSCMSGSQCLCCLCRGKPQQFLTLQAPGGSKRTVKVQSCGTALLLLSLFSLLHS